MSTFKLKFQSPDLLNKNRNVNDVENPQWKHIDGSELEINVEDWVIHKIGKKGSCALSKCQVDESTYTLGFEQDPGTEGGFKVIDYPFAVSMLGQIVPKEELIHYLKQLETNFDKDKSGEPEQKEQDNPHKQEEDEKKENIDKQ